MMAELKEDLSGESKMSHLEILQRFKKLFGREMTEAERKVFFLPLSPTEGE
jgi:hypothetical protein